VYPTKAKGDMVAKYGTKQLWSGKIQKSTSEVGGAERDW
jgi:hypothetical protein